MEEDTHQNFFFRKEDSTRTIRFALAIPFHDVALPDDELLFDNEWSLAEDRLFLKLEADRTDFVSGYAMHHRLNPLLYPKETVIDGDCRRRLMDLRNRFPGRSALLRAIPEDSEGVWPPPPETPEDEEAEAGSVSFAAALKSSETPPLRDGKIHLGSAVPAATPHFKGPASGSPMPMGRRGTKAGSSEHPPAKEDMIIRCTCREEVTTDEVLCNAAEMSKFSPFIRELVHNKQQALRGASAGMLAIDLNEKDPMWETIASMHRVFAADNVLRYKRFCQQPEALDRKAVLEEKMKEVEKQQEKNWNEAVTQLSERQENCLRQVEQHYEGQCTKLKEKLDAALAADIEALRLLYASHAAKETEKIQRKGEEHRTRMQKHFQQEIATMREIAAYYQEDSVRQTQEELEAQNQAVQSIYSIDTLPQLLMLSDVILSSELKTHCLRKIAQTMAASMAAAAAAAARKESLSMSMSAASPSSIRRYADTSDFHLPSSQLWCSHLIRRSTIKELLTMLSDSAIIQLKDNLSTAVSPTSSPFSRSRRRSSMSASGRPGGGASSWGPTSEKAAFDSSKKIIEEEYNERYNTRLAELRAMTQTQLSELVTAMARTSTLGGDEAETAPAGDGASDAVAVAVVKAEDLLVRDNCDEKDKPLALLYAPWRAVVSNAMEEKHRLIGGDANLAVAVPLNSKCRFWTQFVNQNSKKYIEFFEGCSEYVTVRGNGAVKCGISPHKVYFAISIAQLGMRGGGKKTSTTGPAGLTEREPPKLVGDRGIVEATPPHALVGLAIVRESILSLRGTKAASSPAGRSGDGSSPFPTVAKDGEVWEDLLSQESVPGVSPVCTKEGDMFYGCAWGSDGVCYFNGQPMEFAAGTGFNSNDVLGVGVDLLSGAVSFFKNGRVQQMPRGATLRLRDCAFTPFFAVHSCAAARPVDEAPRKGNAGEVGAPVCARISVEMEAGGFSMQVPQGFCAFTRVAVPISSMRPKIEQS